MRAAAMCALSGDVDHDAYESAAFVGKNIKGADSQQAWQFVGAPTAPTS